MTKTTRRERIMKILTFDEVRANPELVAGLEHELELLDRKNKAPKKPNPNAEENKRIREVILEVLRENPDTEYQAAVLANVVAKRLDMTVLTPQRISPILKAMWGEGGTGEVARKVVGKKSFFKIAE